MLLLGNESDAAGFVTVLLLNVFKCILILCFNNAADQHNCANLSPSLRTGFVMTATTGELSSCFPSSFSERA